MPITALQGVNEHMLEKEESYKLGKGQKDCSGGALSKGLGVLAREDVMDHGEMISNIVEDAGEGMGQVVKHNGDSKIETVMEVRQNIVGEGGSGDDPNLILNKLRMKNKDRIIIGHLNINHIENKFDPLVSLFRERLDVFLCSETKINTSFPSEQFLSRDIQPLTDVTGIKMVVAYSYT